MPPGIFVILGLVMVLWFKPVRTQLNFAKNCAMVCCLVMVWVSSTSAFSYLLLDLTQSLMGWPKPLLIDAIAWSSVKQANRVVKKNTAIVILGGGVRRGAQELPQYQYQDVAHESMERLRMGARLAKRTQLPILVSGGAPDRATKGDLSDAQVMATVLEKELGVFVRWQEDQSNTTQENATLSAPILRKNDIQTVFLVTNGWHMPRAQKAFTKEGFAVIPVPLGFERTNHLTPLDYFPSKAGFGLTRHIWHEVLGIWWYRLRYEDNALKRIYEERLTRLAS